MMELFHGSNVKGIQVLEPRLADHDRPYVYLSINEVVAAFYLCNGVERPYYWFPYGFAQDGVTPVYHELYPNALQEVSDGVKGFIYKVLANEKQVISFKSIPCARLGVEPIKVVDLVEIDNAYLLFQEYVKQGKMLVGKFEDKSDREMTMWYKMILEYIKEKDMIHTPKNSYAQFVRYKFPWIWEQYETLCRSV